MDSPLTPVEPVPPTLPDAPPVATWRKILWSLFVVTVVAPAVWVPVVLVILILLSYFSLPETWQSYENKLLVLVPSIITLFVVWRVLRSGLRRGWPGRRSQLIGWGVSATVMAGLIGLGAVWVTRYRVSRKLVVMQPFQTVMFIQQFFVENPLRIFIKFDEQFSGGRAIMTSSSSYDGDIEWQFPVRQGWFEALPVQLPDGTTVRRLDVLAVIGKSGLVATYPLPQGDQFDRKRVYRLDCGVSFRDSHVVNLPPDPAGREGRDQDGVHTYKFPDGRRYEITYRGGVPDGPFYAYHADGTPWGEATYRKGRVVEAWLITRDGRKFDELKDGEAAQQWVIGSLAAASQGVGDSGRQKLAAKDYAGAIADLTRALAINPLDADLHRARGDAYRATGNLDEAINDWCAAEGYTPREAAGTTVPDHLRDAFIERGRQRQQRGDAPGAAQDFRVVTQTAFWRAEELMPKRDFPGALAALNLAIGLAAVAELHDLRADAERGLHRLEAAEADCTRALELAAAGRMRLPANQRIMTAQMHYKRGHLRRWLGRLPEAIADFRAAVLQLGTGNLVNRSDAAQWLFVTQCEAGHRDEAVRELQATDRADWWPAGQQTARFLLGEITETELDAAVAKSNQDGDRLTAELLSGLLRRQAGDEAGALVRFRQAARRFSHDKLAADAAHHAAGQALIILAERALAGGDFAAAAASFKEAVSIDPPASAGLLARYGDARRGAKDLEGALVTYLQSYNESLRAVVPGTDDALAAGLREKITAVNAELEPIRQARAEAQKVARAAAKQPASRPPSPGTLMVEAQNHALKKIGGGDYAGAVADYTRAIELGAPGTMIYSQRAYARRFAGDLDGALADYTKVLQLAPNNWSEQFDRAQLRRLKNDLHGAAEDFRTTVNTCLKNNRLHSPASRAAFWLYLTECERGKAPEAAGELEQVFSKMDQFEPVVRKAVVFVWDRQVADLLLGRLTEEQLLAKVDAVEAHSRNDCRFKALFFSALRRRQTGDQPGAVELFRQALTVPNLLYFEWETAEATRAVSPATP